MRGYTVKENHIGSVVSEILRNTQTNRHRSCYFIIRIIYIIHIYEVYPNFQAKLSMLSAKPIVFYKNSLVKTNYDIFCGLYLDLDFVKMHHNPFFMINKKTSHFRYDVVF